MCEDQNTYGDGLRDSRIYAQGRSTAWVAREAFVSRRRTADLSENRAYLHGYAEGCEEVVLERLAALEKPAEPEPVTPAMVAEWLETQSWGFAMNATEDADSYDGIGDRAVLAYRLGEAAAAVQNMIEVYGS